MLRDLERILLDTGNTLTEDALRSILNSIDTIKHEVESRSKTKMEKIKTEIQIKNWLSEYASNAKQDGYIIGVSGGIDSAVCSTLCAMTGLPLVVVRMSIHQAKSEADRGAKHIEWLQKNFPLNVEVLDIDLTEVYDKEMELVKNAGGFKGINDDVIFLAGANTRSRLRMVTLYNIGNANKLLVCGTGNKVEDYGIGFFTKFGDGGVDLSPIGELMKSEVYALGKDLGIIQEILDARPTDGLWTDGRTDEDQIGATYDELEWALNYNDVNPYFTVSDLEGLTERQQVVLRIYLKRHSANVHKMNMPPVCPIIK